MERIVFVYRGENGPEDIVVERRGSFCSLARGGSIERTDLATLPDGRLSLLFEDGRQVSGRVAVAGPGAVMVVSSGIGRRLELAEPLRDRLAHAFQNDPGGGGQEEVRAPMPGRVVAVSVALGETVEPHGLLMVLEAMKMQNEIRSEHGGTVLRLDVENGRTVESGALLVTLGVKPA